MNETKSPLGAVFEPWRDNSQVYSMMLDIEKCSDGYKSIKGVGFAPLDG